MFRLCRARSSGSVGTRCRDRNTCEMDQDPPACGPQRYQDRRWFRKVRCPFSGRSWSADPASTFQPVSGPPPGSPSRSPEVLPYRKYGRSAGCRTDVLLPRRSSLPLPHSTRWHQGRKRSPSGTPRDRRFSRSQPPLKAPDSFPASLLSSLPL